MYPSITGYNVISRPLTFGATLQYSAVQAATAHWLIFITGTNLYTWVKRKKQTWNDFLFPMVLRDLNWTTAPTLLI